MATSEEKQAISERVINALGPLPAALDADDITEIVGMVINQVINYCESEQETKHLEGVLDAIHTGEGPYLKEAKRFVKIHSFLKENGLNINDVAELDIEELASDRSRAIATFLSTHPEVVDSVKRIYRQGALQELDDDKLAEMLTMEDLNLAQRELLEREERRREHGTAFDGVAAYDDVLDNTFQELNHPLQFALAEKIVERSLEQVYQDLYPHLTRTIVPRAAEQEVAGSEHSL